uniref:Uncharacterized protein n=1 Tax=Picea glauca TaxID=3330 RepID=A0A124GMQ1_PICGL|nr:hypothetical protein ABT39_MTgene1470 [Picea glauca]
MSRRGSWSILRAGGWPISLPTPFQTHLDDPRVTGQFQLPESYGPYRSKSHARRPDRIDPPANAMITRELG